ncbi:methyl-accepting chemotaxis protein [Novosphingobium sp.]|uniref:methyl-accepting chemotaxis protein n=1 Tax=Novosphingobium sp. TaxID=1874826 RepID=UPI00334222EE
MTRQLVRRRDGGQGVAPGMFANHTIASLLTRMNMAAIAVSLCLGGAFVYSIMVMDHSIEEIGRARMPAVIALHTIDMRITEIVQNESRILLNDDPSAKSRFAKLANDLRKSLPADIEGYAKFYRDDQDRIRFESVMALWTKLDRALNDGHAEETAGDFQRARTHFNTVVVPAATELGDALDSAAEDVTADANAAVALGLTTAERGMVMAIVATIVAVGCSFAVMVLSRRRVLLPLSQLNLGLARMAEGDFSVVIPAATQSDEIGAIARSVDAIKTSAAARAEAANAEQKQVVDALGEGLQAIAAGQLQHRITTCFPTEFEKLRAIFNEAMTDLDDLVGRVSGTAHAVKYASSELSSASLDLAKRTETQAARLESTSTAIGSLTRTVRETARGALDVKNGAELAQAQASNGSTVAGNAMAAMSGIAESSNQISQITDLIDAIAFQTNLLALNAGVEAARAGDAGRGFAVVATEVRALAQRSTDAARSIKQLIADSTAQVDLGVKLVASSGEALAGIVDKVTELKALIVGISEATGSQASDLEALSGSVSEMEKMTQQNAAMVEEVSGSARNLQQESDRLGELVQRFAASPGGQVVTMPTGNPPRGTAPRAPARQAPPPISGNLALKQAPAPAADDWSEF